MTRTALKTATARHRVLAATLWVTAAIWVVTDPVAVGMHRVLLTAAMTSTVVAFLSSWRQDLRAVARVFTAAGIAQGRLEGHAAAFVPLPVDETPPAATPAAART